MGLRGLAALMLLTATVGVACSSSSSAGRKPAVNSAPSASSSTSSTSQSGAPILYATFSGEKGTSPYQNVAGITSSGALVQNILQTSSTATHHKTSTTTNNGPTLDELRGMALASNGTLYVANAHKTDSQIIAYSPPASDGTRPYLTTYAAMGSANPGLAHPYGLTVDLAGNVLASSQDTCLVTRFLTSTQTQQGTPSPVASWLTATFPSLQFFPGTWVAQSTTPNSACTASKAQVAHGLQEPRDVVIDGSGNLYVADNPAGVVHVYNVGTGAWVKDLTPSGSGANPVGLDVACSTLYVSSEGTNRVDAIDLATGVATPLPNLTFQAPSGLALVGGSLYVNDRKAEILYRYDLATKTASTFVKYGPAGINDEPEELISTGPAPRCTS